MFWSCFAASGTGCLDCVNGIMKSDDYQIILGCNQCSGQCLEAASSWVLQQENDPKHFKKHSEMVTNKAMESSEMARN